MKSGKGLKEALFFYSLTPFLFMISLLPIWILYIISDFTFIILYYVFNYRKKVVLNNLKNAFPDKSEKELKKISKRYYHYLCDLLAENVKTLTITKKQLLKRCKFIDTSILQKYYSENKNIIITMGHYGNWEWGGPSMLHQTEYPLYVVYKPQTNWYFDKLMYKMRTRLDVKLVKMNNVLKEMLRAKNEVRATTFIADQSPAPEKAEWINFLHQDTPVFTGTERIAKKLNYPIIFVSINRYMRGYYRISSEVLCENPRDTAEGEITKAYMKKLEEKIMKNPEFWLWSHRRWKHKRSQLGVSL